MPYQPFTFVFPTRIVFGPGESGRCAELAAELKPEKVFVCTYADVRLPVLDQLLTGLDQRGVPYYLHAACTANPRAEQIDEAAAIFLREPRTPAPRASGPTSAARRPPRTGPTPSAW